VAPAQRADSALDLWSVEDHSRVARDPLLLDYLKATGLNDSFAILDRYRILLRVISTFSGLASLLKAFPRMKM
jgi:hypothetical protein